MQISIDYQEVYVCDLGIARVKQLTEATMTCQSKGPGTFPYMAPEMFTKSHRGPAVDIYSLGCLYIELFGKQRVWPSLDGPDIMLKVLGAYNIPPQAPDTSHLMGYYADVCSQMCKLEASSRPNSREVLQQVTAMKTLDSQ